MKQELNPLKQVLPPVKAVAPPEQQNNSGLNDLLDSSIEGDSKPDPLSKSKPLKKDSDHDLDGLLGELADGDKNDKLHQKKLQLAAAKKEELNQAIVIKSEEEGEDEPANS